MYTLNTYVYIYIYIHMYVYVYVYVIAPCIHNMYVSTLPEFINHH